jgi:hypothetical protein
MKIFTFLVLLLPFILNSQTVIWSEDFESYTDGTQNTTKWTTSANNCDADGAPGTVGNNYWGTRTTFGDKEFCCEDIEGLTCCVNSQGESDNIWISEDINIIGYTTMSISISMRAEGNMECNSCGSGEDLLNAEYQIDGGVWINFMAVCGAVNGYSQIDCIDIGTGSILKIRVLLGNQADTEEYYFDDIFVYETTCSIALPIELLSFTGEYNENNGLDELKWLTASESNNDRFEIYSSINGEQWNFVGQVAGAGNSSETLSYYYDNKTTTDLVYYRLKQIDYNGDFEYFNIISINKDSESPISIKYYNILGKELKYEPNTGYSIQVISYKYRTEYNRVYNNN